MCVLTDVDLIGADGAGGILSRDRDWTNRTESLHIYPCDDECITPVGYDLRVGRLYASSRSKGPQELAEGSSIKIRPKTTVLIETLETVDMPENRKYSALINSKVSKVSKGLSHISTTIDPDWSGRLLIAVHNHGGGTITLKADEAFCTIVFLENCSPSRKASEKIAQRPDILLRMFTVPEQKARRLALMKSSIPLLVLALVALIGKNLTSDPAQFVSWAILAVAGAEAASLLLREG
jgi:deoxycytidine triphosphate deaminase